MKKWTVIAAGLLVAALLCLGPASVWAQDDAKADTQQISQQAEIEALKAKLAELEKRIEDSEATKATVQKLDATVNDSEGSVQTVISDVSKLKKIKVSGYVQARYEDYQTPSGLSNKADNKTLDNRFYLRRARFKITGQPTNTTLAVVQLDVAGYDRATVASKDVYLEYDPWGVGAPGKFLSRMGQMNYPFGYAIERSSSVRETPERPKVFAGTSVSLPGYPSFPGLFPGERDKGIGFFSTDASKVDWAIGVYNGTGTASGSAGSTFLVSGGKFEDNNAGKAIIGRVRMPLLANLNVGVSGYTGSQAVQLLSSDAFSKSVNQTRWGADFQYYLTGASIKGEYVTGKEPFYSNATTTPNTTSGTNRTVSGWYLLGVKNLDAKNQAVAQYDVLNDKAMANTFGKLGTWNLGVVHFLDDATKVKLFYEINKEEHHTVSNNGLRFEVLTVF